MKKIIVLLLVLLFVLTACNQNNVDRPPMPTPDVPLASDLEHARSLWANANIGNYYLIIKESTSVGSREIKLVVEDGDVLIAQTVEREGGVVSSVTALDTAEAEKYLIRNMLEKVQQDANGEGDVLYNMQAHFDATYGYPVLVTAEAIPNYTEEGSLRLNTDHGYNYVATFDLLLEDIYGVGKETLITLKRSGGEKAWCDTLRVYDDGTALYTNNCDQALLNMKPPFSDFEKLTALLGNFAGVEEVVDSNGGFLDLAVSGAGQGEISSEDHKVLWALVDRFTELLTNPVGEGLTLLYTNSNNFYGLNMLTLMGQPATMPITGTLHGGVVSNAHNMLFIADDAGISSFNLGDGTVTSLVVNPGGKAPYLPIAADDAGYVLLSRMVDGNHQELAWFNTLDHKLKTISGGFDVGCVLQTVNTNPGEVIIASAADGCGNDDVNTGIYLLDMGDGVIENIAGVMDVDITGLTVSPDFDQLITIEDLTAHLLTIGNGTIEEYFGLPGGNVASPVWDPSGGFFFSLHDTEDAGVYRYNFETEESTKVFSSEGITAIGLSPNGEFLLFYDVDLDLSAYTFTREEVLAIDFSSETSNPLFVGWLVAEE